MTKKLDFHSLKIVEHDLLMRVILLSLHFFHKYA